MFDLLEAFQEARERGYNGTQTLLFSLAVEEYGMAAVARIRAVRGLNEVVVECSPVRSELFRYQYEKANAFMVVGGGKAVADIRRSGQWPEILHQRTFNSRPR